jgi:hypothetical protein
MKLLLAKGKSGTIMPTRATDSAGQSRKDGSS